MISDIGLWAAFVLTLMVYTYVIGDSFIYRTAVYIFSGVTAGFVAIVTYDSVITPWLNDLGQTTNLLAIAGSLLPLLFALFLLVPGRVPGLRIFRRIVLAYLIGVGAAVAMVGAVSGTLIPQAIATGQSVNEGWYIGTVTLVGVIAVLARFQYAAIRTPEGVIRQRGIVVVLRWVGDVFLAVTFATLYAFAINSSVVVFSERVQFLIEFVTARVTGG